MHVCMHAKSLQSCLTLCDTMDSSPPGSSVHGILLTRILGWVAISFSQGEVQFSPWHSAGFGLGKEQGRAPRQSEWLPPGTSVTSARREPSWLPHPNDYIYNFPPNFGLFCYFRTLELKLSVWEASGGDINNKKKWLLTDNIFQRWSQQSFPPLGLLQRRRVPVPVNKETLNLVSSNLGLTSWLTVANRMVFYDFWGHEKYHEISTCFLAIWGLSLSDSSPHAVKIPNHVKRPCVGVLDDSHSWAQPSVVPAQVPDRWVSDHRESSSSPSCLRFQLPKSILITKVFLAERPATVVQRMPFCI